MIIHDQEAARAENKRGNKECDCDEAFHSKGVSLITTDRMPKSVLNSIGEGQSTDISNLANRREQQPKSKDDGTVARGVDRTTILEEFPYAPVVSRLR